MSTLGDLIVRIGANIDDFKKGITQAEDDIHHFAETAEHLVQFGESLAITEALKEFGEEALKEFGNIQRVTIALKAMGQEAEQVEKTIEGLKELAISEALSFPALVQAQQRMTAFGIAADQIPGAMHAIADAAGATNRDFDSVAASFEKMALSGNASTKALVGLGISTSDLAEVMGVADKEVKAVFKDFLDESERAQALTEALGKLQGVGEEVAQGLLGQWQNVHTQIGFVFEDLGKALEPVISQILKLINTEILPFIRDLVEVFNELPTPVKDAAVALALIVASIAPLAVGIGGAGLAIQGLSAVLPAANALLGTMGIAITGVGTALAALATAGGWTVVITSVLTLAKAYYELEKAIRSKNEAEEGQDKAIASLEERVTSLGGHISELAGDYGLGLISVTEYVKALRDMAIALSDVEPVADQHKKTIAEIVAANMAAARAEQASAEAAKLLAEAFSTVGLKDLALDAQKASAAFDLLFKKGLLSDNEIIATTEKLIDGLNVAFKEGAISEARFNSETERLGDVMSASIVWLEAAASGVKKFDVTTLDNFFSPFLDLPHKIKPVLDVFEQLKQDATMAAASFATYFTDLDADIQALEGDLKNLNKIPFLPNTDLAVKQLKEVRANLDNPAALLKSVGVPKNTDVDRILEDNKKIQASNQFTDDEKVRSNEAATRAILANERAVRDQVALRLQAEIALKSFTGESATAQIIQLEQIRIKQQALYDASTNLGNLYVGLRKDFNAAFDAMTKGIADNIVEWKSWEETLTNIGKNIAKMLLETILEGALKPIKNYLNQEGGLFDSLSKVLTKGVGAATGSGGGGLGSLLGLGKVGSGEAKQVSGMFHGTSQSGPDVGSGEASGPISGSAGGSTGGLGSLAGLTSVASLGVAVASGITQGIQNSRMINLLGEIEISTRQCKEQLTGGIQTALNTYLPNLLHLVDIWDALINGPLQDIDDMLRYGSIHVTTDMSNIIPAPGTVPGQQVGNTAPVAPTAPGDVLSDILFNGVAADVKSISRNLLNPPVIQGQQTAWNLNTTQGAANAAALALHSVIHPEDVHQSTFDERVTALLASWKDTLAAGGKVAGVGTNTYNPVANIAEAFGVTLKQAQAMFDADAAKQPAEWRATIDPNLRKFNEGLITSEDLLKLQAEAMQRNTDILQDPAHAAAAAQAAALADAQKGLIPATTAYQQAQRDLATSTRALQQQVDGLQQSFWASGGSAAAAAALTAQVNNMGNGVALQPGFSATPLNRGFSSDQVGQAAQQYGQWLSGVQQEMDNSTAQISAANTETMKSKYISTALQYLTSDQSQLMQQLMGMHQDLNTTARKQWMDYVSDSFAKLGASNATGIPSSISETSLAAQAHPDPWVAEMQRRANVSFLERYPSMRTESYGAAPIDVGQSVSNYANNLRTQWNTVPLPGQMGLPFGANALGAQWSQLALSSRDLSGVNGGSIPSSSSIPFFANTQSSGQKADVYVTAVNPDGRTIVRGISEGLREIGVKL